MKNILISIKPIFNRKPDPNTGEVKPDMYLIQYVHEPYDNTIGYVCETVWIDKRFISEDLETLSTYITHEVTFDLVPSGRGFKHVGMHLVN